MSTSQASNHVAASRRAAVEAVGFWWHSIDFGDGLVSPGAKAPALLQEELAGLDLPDLSGKRVLDIGGWDGYFAFAAERRGAAAVTVLDHYVWSLDLPRQQAYWRECQAKRSVPAPYQSTEFWQPDSLPGKRGFDTARRLLDSRVGDIVADFAHADLAAVGVWDVVLFLGVLYHMEDPLDALRRLRSVTGEVAVIETHAIVVPGQENQPTWRFYPEAELNADSSNWWSPNLAGLVACLRAAGFGEVTVRKGPPADGALDYRAIVHAYVEPRARPAEITTRADHAPAPGAPDAGLRADGLLLDRLAATAVLVCPSCAGRLDLAPEALHCAGCGQRYPRRNGIVDFLEYSPAPSDGRDVAAPRAIVDGVIGSLGLADSPETRATVADIYSRTMLRVPSPSLTAEIRSFADRFGVETEPPVAERHSLLRGAVREGMTNRHVRVRFERHYLDGPLPPGASVHRNVRMTNLGRSRWLSSGTRPLRISHRWLSEGGDSVGEPTRFPIPVDPGRTLTVPLRLRTPTQPGRHRLRVQLVRGDDDWIEGTELETEVDIGNPPPAPAGITMHPENVLDYARDHEVAIELLRAFLRPRVSDRRPLLLEIGGGASPQIGPLTELDAVNVDIVAPLLELGALHYGPGNLERLQFLCCDALQPPFPPGAFDGVVMFSTLHHFPEPEVLLQKCRQLLVPGGFVAVMCEPVADTLEYPSAIRDLMMGINEQVFSLEEYFAIFERARLVPESGQLDGGSLKVILRPAPELSGGHAA